MSIDSQIIGDFTELTGRQDEYLILAFSPLISPLRDRWRNNGLSADFLGDYVITFLPKERNSPSAETRQNEIKHAVAYVVNELLENAMKYHENQVDIPISIHMELNSEQITVSVRNGISAPQAERYRTFIGNVLQGDPGDLLIKRLEEGAKSIPSNESCLGLLTILNDYGAKLSWRFDPDSGHPATLTVTTRAVLEV